MDNCIKVLTPIFASVAMNYPPVGANPITGVTALPDQVIYTDPSLRNVPRPPTPRLMPGNTPAGEADIRQAPTDASAAPSNGLGDILMPRLGDGD